MSSHPETPPVASPSTQLIRVLLFALMLALSGCTLDQRQTKDDGGAPSTDASFDAKADDATDKANLPPGPLTIELGPVDPTTVDPLTLTIVDPAFDPDNGPAPITYVNRWFRDGTETLHGGDVLPSQATKRGERWRVEVSATDSLAEGPRASASVLIINAKPSLASVSVSPGAPTTEDALSCVGGAVSDPDGDDTSLEYAWFVDGALQEDLHESAFLPPLPSESPINCAIRPFDGSEYGAWIGSESVVATSIVTANGLLYVNPKALDLGVVLPGEVAESSVMVRNIGDGDLQILSGSMEGDPGFTLATALGLSLAPDEEILIEVAFQTDSPGLKKGKLILETDAMNQDAGKIPLLGLGAASCLTTDSFTVDFGGVYAPTIVTRDVVLRSCGALPVDINAITLSKSDDAPYELDLSQGQGALPWKLEPGAEVTVLVRFMPNNPSPVDAEEKPIAFEAVLSVESSSPGSPMSLPVTGFASATGCPVAIIDSLDGDTVLPNTKVHLSGTDSFGIFGDPSVFTWAVSSVPEGVPIGELSPNPQEQLVSYDVTAPGQYVFHLAVFDQTGPEGGPCGTPDAPCTELISGCSIGVAIIEAKDAIPLIVELTWDTPGDANQGDSGPGKGGDLDLHMHNGTGDMPDYDGDGLPDSFFHHPADCYWFDTTPPWAEPGGQDDPWLALEDPDGAGPERIEFHHPGPGTYTVGAHYWSAFDYGTSIPTIRVLYFETPIYELQGDPMEHGSLWEALKIHWPKATIEQAFKAAGGSKVTEEYPTPF